MLGARNVVVKQSHIILKMKHKKNGTLESKTMVNSFSNLNLNEGQQRGRYITLFKYYRRQIFWTLWGGFCLRFASRCHLFKERINESNIDITMGFIRLERMNMELNRMKKRRLKIENYLKSIE